MSFQAYVQADASDAWTTNGIFLETREEAKAYGHDLWARWMLVRAMEVRESSEPANYAWTDSGLEAADRVHDCQRTDDDGNLVEPRKTTCGNCERSWCDRCDPCPSALCPWCSGRGYSIAPVTS